VGAWFVGLDTGLGVGVHATSAVSLMASTWPPPSPTGGGLPVTKGPAELVGEGVGVGDGVGLSDVGDGVGLADVGDGAGDGELTGGVPAGEHAPAEGTSTLPLGVLPGLADLLVRGVADGLPEPAGPPLPLVPPAPPGWPELLVPGRLSFASPTSVPRICPRAKTPATTRTTAPATASAGRSQVIAEPTVLRNGAPALPAVRPPAVTPAAKRDRIVLSQD